MAEATLLLQEATHRMANELASAIAAIRLVKSARGSGARWRMLDRALERLEGCAELHLMLARPPRGSVDAAAEIKGVCGPLVRARPGAEESGVFLDLEPVVVDAGVARRLAPVTAELVANAIRYALDGRAGRLDVTLRLVRDDLVLSVVDDGPGMRVDAAPQGTGLGSGIVRSLVERAGGVLSIESRCGGTAVQVIMPRFHRIAGDGLAL